MRDVYPDSHWAVRGEPPSYHTADEDVYLEGRNIVLLAKASVFCARHRLTRLAIGPLAGNPFPDATPEFFAAMATGLSDCIDCHTRVEAMGDGDIHSSKKAIQYVQCKTCQGTLTELPSTMTLTNENNVAFRLAQLNPVRELNVGDQVLATEQGEALWNTRVLPDGSYELVGKATGERFKFRPVMDSGCTQKPDEQASQYCHECHAIER